MRRKCGKVRKSDRKKWPLNIRSRKPVPLDLTRPCLAKFPEHIILLILEPLPVEDLLQVALASSELYYHARLVQYYDVCIDLDRRQHVLKRLELAYHRGRHPAVRHLVIKGQLQDEAAEAEFVEILLRIRDMLIDFHFNLRDLHWQARNRTTTVPIPYEILEGLPARARLHLAFHHNCDDGDQSLAQDFLARLKGNPNLRTLVATVYSRNGADRSKFERGLKGLLTSCPNLTRFHPSSLGMGFVAGERPAAPLEELDLGKYQWGSPVMNASAEGGHPRGLGSQECLYWAGNFDWSRLAVLRDVDHYTTQYLIPKMTNLQHLEVGWQHRYHCERDVLAQVCSPLELLSLTGECRRTED